MNIVIYSKPQCAGCEQAKSLLTSKGISYETKDITNPANLMELKNLIPNVRSVPQIYINDTHIGGIKELREYLNKRD